MYSGSGKRRIASRSSRRARCAPRRRSRAGTRCARELVAVSREPGVGLDRDRVGASGLAALDRVGQPVAVALRLQVAAELVDEQPAVREDQDAEVPRASTNPAAAIVLPGRSRMAEAVAARRAGVLRDGSGRPRREARRPLRPRPPPARRRAGDAAVPGAVAVLLGAPLRGAISSVSIPASASIWCRRSAVPDAVAGVSAASTRSSPSISP